VLPGYTPEPRLAWAYRNATALLFPSEYEGFGIPLVEAMTLGLPVITTRRGSIPEVVGDAALFVDPQQPASLADATLRLLGDDTLREQLVAKGRERAQGFSWESAAEALLREFRTARTE
jgi:glycosyltransferase involved in cell wall biosynthesis